MAELAAEAEGTHPTCPGFNVGQVRYVFHVREVDPRESLANVLTTTLKSVVKISQDHGGVKTVLNGPRLNQKIFQLCRSPVLEPSTVVLVSVAMPACREELATIH
jgi:hypothetical protein